MTTDTHADLIERIVAWASSEDNIRAVVMTGSATRAGAPTDRFSDRDVELICRDPTPLATDDAWIHAVAPVWVALYLDNGEDFDTRLVFFEGGRKVDFTLARRSRLDEMRASGELDPLYERGYRVLLDKDGLAEGLPEPAGAAPKRALPSERELGDTVTEFWFEAAHMPTYLTRGDLWVVKSRDWTMKEMLLRMLEWHALATGGEGMDTWHIGSKMRWWVDDATWQEVHQVFGRFDRADSWRALMTSMRLFTLLTRETADALGFGYPRDAERHITRYVLGFERELSGDA